jgi:hypothetical protein
MASTVGTGRIRCQPDVMDTEILDSVPAGGATLNPVFATLDKALKSLAT